MKTQSFIVGFFCVFLGWETRKRFEKWQKHNRQICENSKKQRGNTTETAKTDFYGGIGSTQKKEFSNIF